MQTVKVDNKIISYPVMMKFINNIKIIIFRKEKSLNSHVTLPAKNSILSNYIVQDSSYKFLT